MKVLDRDPLKESERMAGISSLDEQVLSQNLRFFQLVPHEEWGNLTYQQHEGTFGLQSTQHQIHCLCRDRNDEHVVCSPMSSSDWFPESERTRFLLVLSICDSTQRTCCSSPGSHYGLIRSGWNEEECSWSHSGSMGAPNLYVGLSCGCSKHRLHITFLDWDR